MNDSCNKIYFHFYDSQFPTLENCRLYLKLCTLYKIIHGYFYFPTNVYVPQVDNSHSLPLIHQPRAHTNAFQSSFVPSSVSVWNHLPHEAHHTMGRRLCQKSMKCNICKCDTYIYICEATFINVTTHLYM